MTPEAHSPGSVEAQLEQQARQFGEVMSALSDFIYIFDTEGRFSFANPALTDLLGLTLSDIRGKTFFELPYPEALAAKLHQQIGVVVQTQAEVRDETPFMSPSGVQGYYEYIFRPIFAADGQVEAVAGSTRDISECKAAELALAEQHERQKLANTLHDGV